MHYRSGFFGPAERFLRDSGADVQYVPADFRRFAPIIEALAPRVMATVAAPRRTPTATAASRCTPGRRSTSCTAPAPIPTGCSSSSTPSATPAPFGLMPDHPHRLHLDEIDIIVESDSSSPSTSSRSPGGRHRPRDRRARPRVTCPTARRCRPASARSRRLIATLLAEGTGGEYGVHSEMFTTGLMRLHQAGKVTNSHKGEYDGFSVTTFAAGTPELYDWLDGNDRGAASCRSTSSTRATSSRTNRRLRLDQRRDRGRPAGTGRGRHDRRDASTRASAATRTSSPAPASSSTTVRCSACARRAWSTTAGRRASSRTSGR